MRQWECRDMGKTAGRKIEPLFDRVVMATDLTPAWDQVVSCGSELRDLGCSRVILTFVITPNLFSGGSEGPPPQAAARLAAQRRVLEARGLEVIIETPIGLPGFSLNEVAHKYDASMIIIGSHGKSRWREGVLGTFSSAVLHNAQFPLLVLPVAVEDGQPPSCLWRCSELLDHLLFPTDFSQTAAEALCYLELLALRGVHRVTLLHALHPPTGQFSEPKAADEAAAVARNFLDVLKGRLEAAGVLDVKTRVSVGHPVPVILDVLQTSDISLLVLGTQGKGFIAELYLGSVAHNISRFAPCPILLIPPADRECRE
ncbi:MAG: universal stress protein [Syntrophobacterales bacterium]|jgi:nucleotide-binding universal stress UspA family protein|nr:universal stress protein [Syntrophobacterales bacterium]